MYIYTILEYIHRTHTSKHPSNTHHSLVHGRYFKRLALKDGIDFPADQSVKTLERAQQGVEEVRRGTRYEVCGMR